MVLSQSLGYLWIGGRLWEEVAYAHEGSSRMYISRYIAFRDNYVFVNQIVYVFSTGSCRYLSSSKAFLFSLYNVKGYAPVKVNIKSGHYDTAIYTCSSRGPTFGNGHDLHISNNAASNRKSFTDCDTTYPLPPGYSASNAYCGIYAGSCKFTPSDVEVFYETKT